MEEVFKTEALRITREHYHAGIKDLDLAKQSAIVTVKNIIKETLGEYTNDENHDRVIFYNKVLEELKDLWKMPDDYNLNNKKDKTI